VNVDAVHQWPRYFSHVLFDLWRRAVATSPGIAAIATGTGVRRGNQHEVGGEGGAPQGSRDCDDRILHRLAHDFERLAIEFGEFVEEQDPVVRLADLARRRRTAAADQTGVADRVMWSAKGTTRQ
jgi:hypothetical protein